MAARRSNRRMQSGRASSAVKEKPRAQAREEGERAMAAEGGLPMDGDENGDSPEMPEDESEAGMAPVEAS